MLTPILFLLVCPLAEAVEYECKVNKKLNHHLEYTDKQLEEGQFSVIIKENMTFVENNGRGGIAYGKCKVITP